jgi:hypothetical protein
MDTVQQRQEPEELVANRVSKKGSRLKGVLPKYLKRREALIDYSLRLSRRGLGTNVKKRDKRCRRERIGGLVSTRGLKYGCLPRFQR